MSLAQPVKIWMPRAGSKMLWIIVATAVVQVVIAADAWVRLPANRPWIAGLSVVVVALFWVMSRSQVTVTVDPAVVVITRWLRTKRIVLNEHISVGLRNDWGFVWVRLWPSHKRRPNSWVPIYLSNPYGASSVPPEILDVLMAAMRNGKPSGWEPLNSVLAVQRDFLAAGGAAAQSPFAKVASMSMLELAMASHSGAAGLGLIDR